MVHMVDGGKEGNITSYSVQQTATEVTPKSIKVGGVSLTESNGFVTVSSISCNFVFKTSDWVGVYSSGDIIFYLRYTNPVKVMLSDTLRAPEKQELNGFFKSLVL